MSSKDTLTTRFFTEDDERTENVACPLPAHWWSRFYEYAWAAEFCKETDVVLDAACGLPHPFKFYLADSCKTVHAVDSDERILDMNAILAEMAQTLGETFNPTEHGTVNFKQASIANLSYRNGMFDKVFCISALEHLSDEDKLNSLKGFRKVIKNNGMIILTLDYPDTTIETMERLADEAGLKLAGDKNEAIPTNSINWENKLYCFRMVLVKK